MGRGTAEWVLWVELLDRFLLINLACTHCCIFETSGNKTLYWNVSSYIFASLGFDPPRF